MKRLLFYFSIFFASGLLIGLAFAVVPEELDPVKVSPQTVKVLFENASVRVLEAKVPSGGQEPKHRHVPSLTVYLTDMEMENISFPDGTVSRQQRKVGEAVWNEARVHQVRNVGKTPIHAIVVELKNADQVKGLFNSDLDPLKIAGDTHKLLLDNKYVRVIEAKIPPGKLEPKHSHPKSVVVYLGDFDAQIKTFPDGKSSQAHRKFGTALWSEPTVHEIRNIGTTPGYAVRVELKD